LNFAPFKNFSDDGRKFGMTINFRPGNPEQNTTTGYRYLQVNWKSPRRHSSCRESVPEEENQCIISMDEINIKTELSDRREVDKMKVSWIMTTLYRQKGVCSLSHALIVCSSGIVRKWKQPLGYILSNGSTPAEVRYILLLTTLGIAIEIGLVPRALVSDQGSNNQSMVTNYSKVTPKTPVFYYKQYETVVMIVYIFFIYFVVSVSGDQFGSTFIHW
jgi:hypothetical protein